MFTLSFAFNRDKTSLDTINAALSSLALSSLTFQGDPAGCAMIIQQRGPDNELLSVSYGYCFDQVTFRCEREEDSPLYHWQIDAEVLPASEIRDGDTYHDLWCATHPDRVMRFLQVSGTPNSGLSIFIVFHHEKPENGEE